MGSLFILFPCPFKLLISLFFLSLICLFSWAKKNYIHFLDYYGVSTYKCLFLFISFFSFIFLLLFILSLFLYIILSNFLSPPIFPFLFLIILVLSVFWAGCRISIFVPFLFLYLFFLKRTSFKKGLHYKSSFSFLIPNFLFQGFITLPLLPL